ncbi:MAG: hypothetical protein CR984_02485, partial [Proteobacteria bacterium]
KAPAARSELKARIQQVIQENPELIHLTLRDYANRIREKNKIRRIVKNAFDNRLADTVSPENPSKGPAAAPITMIVYNSFQCFTCAEVARMAEEILAAYPFSVRVVFKNHPLGDGTWPARAARAAMAAHRQGRFWPYHDLLYTAPILSEQRLKDMAKALGLDPMRFDRDRHSEALAARIQAEHERAEALGLVPPGVLINGVRMDGKAFPLHYYTTVIDDLLAEIGQVGK